MGGPCKFTWIPFHSGVWGDVNWLVPTVAHQLGISCHPFKEALCEALDKDQSLASLGLPAQFERLVAQPLRTVEHEIPSGLLVIVIDALDELADRLDASRVLDTLLQQVSGLLVKFFITCRPDSSLLNKLSRDRSAQSLYHLHDIERSLVQADIKIYLRHQLSSMSVKDQWMKQLVEQSGHLFIYASTAVQYVGLEDESLDHQERLEVILGVDSCAVTRSHEQLNELYTTILSAALEDRVREEREIERIKLVLFYAQESPSHCPISHTC
ncbi:Vegetative incompatibility protein HET-E-1 [Ceratobasidium sp. AG-Ba]|nr:Vegetative incompatibility protein HET-E-1 [Ceratobasidium sp. AG-Ba]